MQLITSWMRNVGIDASGGNCNFQRDLKIDDSEKYN